MNNKFLALVLTSMIMTIMALIVVVTKDTKQALGEVAIDAVTEATSTPQVADRFNLCPQVNPLAASSTTGTFDFITVTAPLAADLLIMDATTTNSALRLPSATSSNILIWLPAGTGTTTIKMGVQFKRGLLVDYGAGNASTTIGFRCEG